MFLTQRLFAPNTETKSFHMPYQIPPNLSVETPLDPQHADTDDMEIELRSLSVSAEEVDLFLDDG